MRLSVLWFLVWLLLSLAPGAVRAATYYVSPAGSDGVACAQAQSSQRPRRTINGGIACLSRGDTLLIGSGTYNEVIAVARAGAPAAIPGGASARQPTTLKASPGATVLLQPTMRNDSSGAVITIEGVSHVVIDGLNVDGSAASPYTTYGVTVSGSRNRLENLDIQQVQTGVFVQGTGHTFRNLHVHHIAIAHDGSLQPCIASDSSTAPQDFPGYCHGYYFQANHSVLEGGLMHDINGHGIQFYAGGPHNNTMRNVTVCRTRVGIGIYGPSHQITQNVLVGNRVGILAKNSGNRVSDNRLVGNAEAISDQGSQTVLANNRIEGLSAELAGTLCAPGGSPPPAPPVPAPYNLRGVVP